ncbi:MAG: glycosyltransferase family 4 protein [Thermovirgaceae bacterium]
MAETADFPLKLFFLGVIFFGWALLVTPFSIRLSERYRILDSPGGRKRHEGLVPRGSGVVFWIGYLMLALFLSGSINQIHIVATGATLVFLLGYIDDMKGLSARFRFLGHLVAAALVASVVPVPLTYGVILLFWIAGGISAYNLIDGMNGLALTLFFITSLFGIFIGDPAWWIPVGAMVMGMFYWNFPVARTFLGDGGSTLLGFLCMSQLSIDGARIFPEITLPVLCVGLFLVGGIPFIDTASSILRRVSAGKSPFTPDRGHIHHLLLDHGLPQKVVLLVLSAAHGLCIAGGFFILGGL